MQTNLVKALRIMDKLVSASIKPLIFVSLITLNLWVWSGATFNMIVH
jgi:hypothetical protein